MKTLKIYALLLSLSFVALAGCSSKMQAIKQIIQDTAISADPNRFENYKLDPKYQYVEVHGPGVQALMALGFALADEGKPPIQTWYGSDASQISFQNGRLVGFTGISPSQRNTTYHWSPANEDQRVPVAHSRSLDIPEFQLFSYSESLSVEYLKRESLSFDSVLLKRLRNRSQNYIWLKEERSGVFSELPASVYAFNQSGLPVYGSQCIQANFCFEWLFRKNQ